MSVQPILITASLSESDKSASWLADLMKGFTATDQVVVNVAAAKARTMTRWEWFKQRVKFGAFSREYAVIWRGALSERLVEQGDLALAEKFKVSEVSLKAARKFAGWTSECMADVGGRDKPGARDPAERAIDDGLVKTE